jgi:hypothetical protein
MMAPSMVVNLLATAHCSQDESKYKEDLFPLAYKETEDEKDLKYNLLRFFDAALEARSYNVCERTSYGLCLKSGRRLV